MRRGMFGIFKEESTPNGKGLILRMTCGEKRFFLFFHLSFPFFFEVCFGLCCVFLLLCSFLLLVVVLFLSFLFFLFFESSLGLWRLKVAFRFLSLFLLSVRREAGHKEETGNSVFFFFSASFTATR